jgi:hypothetical protein
VLLLAASTLSLLIATLAVNYGDSMKSFWHLILPYFTFEACGVGVYFPSIVTLVLVLRYVVPITSEKDSTCISPFVHPNVHVITCSSFMWPEMHASTEEFTWFLYVRTPLVIASHNLFRRGQKDALTSLLIHAN